MPRLANPALIFLVAAVYARAVAFGWQPTWDDELFVLGDSAAHTLDLGEIVASARGGVWHPIHRLAVALQWALFGGSPAGFHAVSVGLHAAVVLAVRAWLLRWGEDATVAWLVAAAVAVHPVNVEAVAWVAEQKTLLSALGVIAALALWTPARTNRHRALALLCFAGALLAKATVAPLPAVLMLKRRWLEDGRWGLGETAPFWALALGHVALTMKLFAADGMFEPGALSLPVLLGAVWPTMVPTWWEYPRLLAWPFGLSAIYDVTMRSSFAEPAVVVALGGLVAATLAAARAPASVRFWAAWFVLWLLPVANLVPHLVFYADRYLYLPAIGAFVLLFRLPVPRAVPAALLAAWAVIAGLRVGVWRDDLTLFEDAAAKAPAMYKARLNLGVAYEGRGRWDEAEREYAAALAIEDRPEARQNLAMVRARRGR